MLISRKRKKTLQEDTECFIWCSNIIILYNHRITVVRPNQNTGKQRSQISTIFSLV